VKDCRHRGERADSPVTYAAEPVLVARGTSSMSPCRLLLEPGEVVGAGRGSCQPGACGTSFRNVDGSQLRGRGGSSGSSQPSPAGWHLYRCWQCSEAWSRSPLLGAARVPAVRSNPARNRAARRLSRSVAPGLPARSSGGSHTGLGRADDRESMAVAAILRTCDRI